MLNQSFFFSFYFTQVKHINQFTLINFIHKADERTKQG